MTIDVPNALNDLGLADEELRFKEDVLEVYSQTIASDVGAVSVLGRYSVGPCDAGIVFFEVGSTLQNDGTEDGFPQNTNASGRRVSIMFDGEEPATALWTPDAEKVLRAMIVWASLANTN